MSRDYKSAGVDVNAGYEAVRLIKKHARRTLRPEAFSELGGFGGMFSIAAAKNMADPVLVSGTDGVGTKLKVAFILDKHDTVGIDCVAMCVNDVICSGAEPLFFLDYIACGKNKPTKIAEIVKGVADGCEMAGAALIGGETAEMPGFYNENEYDIAGFTVGIVDRPKMIDGSGIAEGDAVVGIASNGLHSNGFSLVRQVLRPNENNVTEFIQSLGSTLGDELIKPTKIYVNALRKLRQRFEIKGVCNITGGGFIENMPRMLPAKSKLGIKIYEGSWTAPPIFAYIGQAGELQIKNMYNIFNMGIGMAFAVAAGDARSAADYLESIGEKAFVIGEVVSGQGVEIC